MNARVAHFGAVANSDLRSGLSLGLSLGLAWCALHPQPCLAQSLVSARSVTLRGEQRHERRWGLLGNAASPSSSVNSDPFVEREGSVELQGNGKWKPTESFSVGADLSGLFFLNSKPSHRWKWVTSESYFQWESQSALSVLAGKKRISWGSGIAQNPMDFLNPPKNPLDPSLQKEGAWLGQLEYPGEGHTFSILASAEMEETPQGIWKKLDLERRAFAARAYFLVNNTDITVAAYHTHFYQNSFHNKPVLGLSISRLVTSATELHFEGTAKQGSARTYVNSTCVASAQATLQCARRGLAISTQSKLTSQRIFPQFITGTRTQFSDDSLLSLEILYQGDGDSKEEFANKLRLLETLRVPLQQTSPGGAAELQRHWYFSMNYQRWKVVEDLFLSSSVLLNLEDSSGLFSPQTNWTPEDWLSFTLSGTFHFVAIRQTYDRVHTRANSEFQLSPQDASVKLEAKAYF